MPACAACGSDVRPGSGFCRACGLDLAPRSAAPTATATAHAGPYAATRILGGLCFALGAIGCVLTALWGVASIFLGGTLASVLLPLALSLAAVWAGASLWRGKKTARAA